MGAWKSQENRRLRHNAKQLINTCEDYDALIIPILDDYDTLWGSPQDGRKWYQEKPLLNQCEVDFGQTCQDAYKWYSNDLAFAKRIKSYIEYYKHGGRGCNCYTNKRGWYWKNLRK
jgi:hypothetical protein